MIGPPCIGVTGAGTRSGLAVIRDIGRAGIRVVGLDHERMPFGLHSRWSEPYRVLPRPVTMDGLLDGLRAAKAQAMLPMQSWIVRIITRDLARVEREIAVNLPDHMAFRA